MELDWSFPKHVTEESEGVYRWTYKLKENGNNAPLRTMVRICLAVSLPITLIMLVLTWQYDPPIALLSTACLFAGMVLLPALLWKLMPPDPSFRMDAEQIESWPKGKGNNIHSFKGVRRVVLRPDIDRIRLRWTVTGLDVYVPKDDYEFVTDFILAHIPERAEVLRG